MCVSAVIGMKLVEVQSGDDKGSMLKDVLRRSVRRSMIACSLTPSAADDHSRHPLRSILHSADINTCDSVGSEHVREPHSSGKKYVARYTDFSC